MNYWNRKNKQKLLSKQIKTFAHTAVPLHATNCIILSCVNGNAKKLFSLMNSTQCARPKRPYAG